MTGPKTSENQTLTFIVAIDEDLTDRNEKGIFGSVKTEPVAKSVNLAILRRNLQDTLNGLAELFEGITQVGTDLPLKEVEISFEVTAKGRVALLGTSAETAGKGGIKILFGR
ncbi:hypothetical protein [Amycolatopsis sp. SB7-3]|uniref:Pepco domain-containing protein n=1 Tax=Amycolatopsis sp. SB7-3 TaxID=3373438 RepID=UPI003742F23E